ncbi:MAG: hypothetical protein IIA45_09120 [Bacteroidetes bacterium]|nr:hypothetical protein [Bacteroidota bacterium]
MRGTDIIFISFSILFFFSYFIDIAPGESGGLYGYTMLESAFLGLSELSWKMIWLALRIILPPLIICLTWTFYYTKLRRWLLWMLVIGGIMILTWIPIGYPILGYWAWFVSYIGVGILASTKYFKNKVLN